ncbi:hypothetical protein AU106_gp062 [Sinorhizobium phage phiM9]|uniref:Uncharacterized protein n=1 Tax=Sinorhizobium phage phiM9 TaxID=1636182 RepID=A0A0F6R7E8_9CAUD|nr:hypothetical protein AU106_gp062 [Sinorhizobium phage phiM9]AKE44693.1 hypothetical protein Sm_phiM9_063 [Sinorhizobium phage phiM9]
MRSPHIVSGVHEFFENIQIGLAKNAYRILSSDAQTALDQWETSGWVGGALEKHFRANDMVAQEIELAFAPIRAKLPSAVKLYRGMVKDSNYNHYNGRLLESWTDDRKVAEHFAGLRHAGSWKSILYDIHSNKDIFDAVDRYEKTGFVMFDGYRYARSKQDPSMFDVFDRSRQPIGDGENLKKTLLSNNEDRKRFNADRLAKAVLIEKSIPRERIVWITNNLNSKEYIVRV